MKLKKITLKSASSRLNDGEMKSVLGGSGSSDEGFRCYCYCGSFRGIKTTIEACWNAACCY